MFFEQILTHSNDLFQFVWYDKLTIFNMQGHLPADAASRCFNNQILLNVILNFKKSVTASHKNLAV